MHKPTEIRAAIVSSIEEKFKNDFNHISAHTGGFTRKTINKITVKAPACLVSCIKLDKPERGVGGEANVSAKFAVFIILNDGVYRKASNDKDPLELIEEMSEFIAGNRFGLKMRKVQIPPVAQNLANEDLKSKQVSIWALHFDVPATVKQADHEALANDVFTTQVNGAAL